MNISSTMASAQHSWDLIWILKHHNHHVEPVCHIWPFPLPQHSVSWDLCHPPSSTVAEIFWKVIKRSPANPPAQMASLLSLSASVATLCQGGRFPTALSTCLNIGGQCHLGCPGVPKASAQKWQTRHRTTGNLSPSVLVERSQAAPESYYSTWLEHLTLFPTKKMGEWYGILPRRKDKGALSSFCWHLLDLGLPSTTIRGSF